MAERIQRDGIDTKEAAAGKYTILRPLGRGGEGSVYLARDEHLQRFVAVKQIRSRMSEAHTSGRPDGEDQVVREAACLQGLRHPLLPTVYDLFDCGGDRCLAMEYIQGMNLREYIERNGPVQEERLRRWAGQLADVLDYLHTRKPPVIYSDLKPDNIMICPDGQIRLVDFGAAWTRSFGAVRDRRMAVTRGYGAPEQWGDRQSGHSESVSVGTASYADERSDIYALGKVMYYMATAADPARPPYATLPVYEYQPLLGDSLERILRKCMDPKPERRYQTAGQVREELAKGKGKRRHRRTFIRMVEKRIWLTEGEEKMDIHNLQSEVQYIGK